ncbi:hypothetical protein C2E23DRAFT_523151 [Lenzites betulinus]|nr:hypothetical protein C2E23DRAFT_523151 [Lenzites betulinus]
MSSSPGALGKHRLSGPRPVGPPHNSRFPSPCPTVAQGLHSVPQSCAPSHRTRPCSPRLARASAAHPVRSLSAGCSNPCTIALSQRGRCSLSTVVIRKGARALMPPARAHGACVVGAPPSASVSRQRLWPVAPWGGGGLCVTPTSETGLDGGGIRCETRAARYRWHRAPISTFTRSTCRSLSVPPT